MVKEGGKAPAFTLVADNEQKVSLKDFIGKNVVLYFYPKDNTPGCTKEASGFSDEADKFEEKNTVILGVSKDSIASHRKFKEKHDLSFDLLCDEDGKVCELYGVWQEKTMCGKTKMGIVRTTFIIDAKGMITKIFSNVKVNGHVEKVLNEI